MFGVKIDSRETQLLELMKLGRPISAICEIIGVDHDYCRKLCVRLAKQHGLEYKPQNVMSRGNVVPVGITEASKRLRIALGDKLYDLGEDRDKVAGLTGLTRRGQKYARERPNNHDWTISQIERLCVANDVDFTETMLEALLGTQQYKKVLACLNR